MAIATGVGGTSDVLGAAGVGRLIPPGDIAALAEAMLWAATISDLERATIGQAARQRIVGHFSLPAQVNGIADLIEMESRRWSWSQPLKNDNVGEIKRTAESNGALR